MKVYKLMLIFAACLFFLAVGNWVGFITPMQGKNVIGALGVALSFILSNYLMSKAVKKGTKVVERKPPFSVGIFMVTVPLLSWIGLSGFKNGNWFFSQGDTIGVSLSMAFISLLIIAVAFQAKKYPFTL